jgi:hypothetical protein
VVDKQRGQVVADELAANVDEVVEPEDDDLIGGGSDEGEEDVTEDLVAIEGEIVGKPT